MRAYFVTKDQDGKFLTSKTYHNDSDLSENDFKLLILGEIFNNHPNSNFCAYLNANDKGYQPWLGSDKMFNEVYSLLFKYKYKDI